MVDHKLILQVNDLVFSYGSESIFDGVSMTLHEDRIAVLVGPSGIGKSTLLDIIEGQLSPDAGSVYVMSSAGLVRPRVAWVGQRLGLPLWFSLKENLDMVFQAKGRATNGLEDLILAAGLGNLQKGSHQLSHGMKRRAELIRAVASFPDLLLLDEVFAGTDWATRDSLSHALLRLRQETRSMPVLLATHDLDHAAAFADTIFVLAEKPVREIRLIDARNEAGPPMHRSLSAIRKLMRRINALSAVSTHD